MPPTAAELVADLAGFGVVVVGLLSLLTVLAGWGVLIGLPGWMHMMSGPAWAVYGLITGGQLKKLRAKG